MSENRSIALLVTIQNHDRASQKLNTTAYQIGPRIVAVLHFIRVWQSHAKRWYGLSEINTNVQLLIRNNQNKNSKQ